MIGAVAWTYITLYIMINKAYNQSHYVYVTLCLTAGYVPLREVRYG